jgi:hypothetical protein
MKLKMGLLVIKENMLMEKETDMELLITKKKRFIWVSGKMVSSMVM